MTVVVLQETWCKCSSSCCPIHYREIIDPSTKLKGVTQGRESGGMIIWYKSECTDSIELIKRGEFYIS